MCAIDNSVKEVIILEVPEVGGCSFLVGAPKKERNSDGRVRTARFHRVG